MQAMTNVDDSVLWREPYLYVRRFGTDGTDAEKFRGIIERAVKRNGMTFDSFLETAKKLPFGYLGSEGLLMFVIAFRKQPNK